MRDANGQFAFYPKKLKTANIIIPKEKKHQKNDIINVALIKTLNM